MDIITKILKTGPNHILSRPVLIGLNILLFLVVALPSVAQDELRDYLKKAAENNPELKASFREYMAAAEKVPQVGSLPDPELTIGYFVEPMERFMGKQRAEISLMQMFPWFGMIKTRKNEASLMAEAQYESFLSAKNELFYEVKDAWYNIYLLEKQIGITQKNLALLKTLERVALTRYQNASTDGAAPAAPSPAPGPSSGNSGGMGSMNGTQNQTPPPSSSSGMTGMASAGSNTGMSDVLWIKMEMKELENQLASLNDAKRPLLISFNKLLNRNLTAPVKVPDSIASQALVMEEQELLDSIISSNPMIAMLEKEGEAYKTREIMAKKEGLPMFGLGVNYSVFSPRTENGMTMGGDDMLMPMATFTIPIYRKKYNAQRKEAELLQEATEQKIVSVENDLAVQWAESLRELKDAERKIDLLQEQTKLARQSLNILLSAYASEGVEFDKLLTIHRQLLDFELRLHEAIVAQNRSVAMLDMLMAKEIAQQ